ncbi:PREDICTED: protein CLT1, chloroplastic isoform X1 [Theobroma cacao]|uniref:Protein CLT1, chloroplastic isoform X1 n=1 Tax=Theobroma cacao TaxID=3641 RepID=A0AB32WWD3_THECC|nr:PREDICTED: protein CLT1, chloroplastic isoform X1 [Theobroma cacao]
MTSCYHRLTAGQTLPNIPVQPPKIKPTASNIPLIPPRPCMNQRPVRIVLRLRKCWRVEAVGPVGRSESGDGAKKAGPGAGPGPGPCSYLVGNQRVGDRTVETGRRERNRAVEVVVAAGVTVVLGVGNRVLYKLALVPLKHYPFFLAQLATFGYVLVYFSILYLRYHAGIVTDEMLSMPKAPFLAVGLLEALAAATGMAAGAILSGASIPILSQTFLVWQILLSIIFLGRRYRVNQLVGCFLVAVGVIITVASGSGSGFSLKEAGIFWSLLMIVSFLLQAADTVLKEVIFLNAAERLECGSVDLFVVNSYGSAFQALFICLLLPFLSKLWGIPFSQLPNYLKDGAACFLNISGTISSGCDGAPLLPLLFVIVNMGFNISLLHLLKISSAVVSSLASTFSVPISVYVFTLPLPYLGVASSLPTGFVAGAVVLVLGLLVYAWSPSGSSSALA